MERSKNYRSIIDRLSEKINDSAFDRKRMFKMALPNDQNLPTISSEISDITSVTSLVCVDLGSPKLGIRLRWPAFAAVMAMPKTAVDKESLPPRTKNNVRFARERLHMQSVPITQSMKHTAN
jgi:hypothetical protein